MDKYLFKILKLMISLIPLCLIQVIGVLIGHIFNLLNTRSRNLLVSNLTNSNIYNNKSDLKKVYVRNFIYVFILFFSKVKFFIKNYIDGY